MTICSPAWRRLVAGVITSRVAERLHVTDDQKLAALAVLRNRQRP